MKEQHAEEGLKFSIDEGQIGPFLEQRGLKLVNHMNKDEIERAYLIGVDGKLIGHITGHFRFVLASKK